MKAVQSLRFVYNIVTHDKTIDDATGESKDEVEIIARTFDEGVALRFVDENRHSYFPIELFATRIPAHAFPNPFHNVLELK
jgi:hypothetical protein